MYKHLKQAARAAITGSSVPLEVGTTTLHAPAAVKMTLGRK